MLYGIAYCAYAPVTGVVLFIIWDNAYSAIGDISRSLTFVTFKLTYWKTWTAVVCEYFIHIPLMVMYDTKFITSKDSIT